MTPKSTPGISLVTFAVFETILLPVVGFPVNFGFSEYGTISISVPVTLVLVNQLKFRVVAALLPNVTAIPDGKRKSSAVGVTGTLPLYVITALLSIRTPGFVSVVKSVITL